MALPTVAFSSMSGIDREVQPAVDLEEQVGPVKESTQRQRQVSSPVESEVGKAWPPFSHVNLVAHLERVDA